MKISLVKLVNDFKSICLILAIFLHQMSVAQTTEFKISEADMSIKMPNTAWKLTTQKGGNYIFKRTAVADADGRLIVPAIMIFVEDASDFKQDVTSYSIAKRLMFNGKRLEINKVLIAEGNKDYPIALKNSYLTMCSYTDQGLDHILYMIHIINKKDKGIQIYMDMTKSIADKYSAEFWTAMKSIR